MLFKNRHLTASAQAGFTLIELLVIVAIIAVIAAIGWPIIANQREQRRRAICNEHLGYGIGLSIIQYAEDYNEFFPMITTGPVVPGRSMTWRQAIMPYAKHIDNFQCPSNPASASDSPVDVLPLSYDVADCGPIRRIKPLKLSDVAISAQTILVFEENVENLQTQQIGVAWDQNSQVKGDINILYGGHDIGQSLFGRHGGMAYHLFADGHCRTLPPMDTIANGINMWHVNNHDPVTPGALKKLQAAQRNFG